MSLWLKMVAVILVLVLPGCGSQGGPQRKSTYKVTGVVVVDGQPPMAPVQLVCHTTQGPDTKLPSTSTAISDADGTFAFSTYESGDGVPPGEYTITVTWQEFRALQMSYSGPDRLKGRYSDPAKSEIKLTVTDSPVELGELQLKTE